MAEQFGPYRLESLLGQGGMGEVYRAVDTRKNRGTVALKRLPAALASDEEFKRRFQREAELAARLASPHVIPIHDFGLIEGQPFLDMRLVNGVDLSAVLAREGFLSVTRASSIILQVADALADAHSNGLVHRDVKPQNILIHQSSGDFEQVRDFAYLIDFGIAANVHGTKLTSTGTTLGTAAYMAPERFQTGDGDHRLDVYALGCVLYESLTGATPFAGRDFVHLMYRHLNDPPPRPSERRGDVNRALDNVVHRSMAKNPDDRYQSIPEFANALSSSIAQEPSRRRESHIDTAINRQDFIPSGARPERLSPPSNVDPTYVPWSAQPASPQPGKTPSAAPGIWMSVTGVVLVVLGAVTGISIMYTVGAILVLAGVITIVVHVARRSGKSPGRT